MKIKNHLLTHLLICSGFLLIPFMFLAAEVLSMHDVFHNPFNASNTVIFALLLIFYYVNYYYLIPRVYVMKRYKIYVILLISILLLFSVLYYFIDYLPYHTHTFCKGDNPPPHPFHHHDGEHRHSRRMHPPPIAELSQLVFLYVIGIFVTLYIRIKKYMDLILQEKNSAELSYLKSQINPHFLFNTFNSIYSLAVKEKADQTANGMLKLSGMMRYVVSETSSEFVLLEKEINYINDFIELQKLRLDKGVHFTYVLNGSIDEQKIAPLILIPFIENAFKHGVNPDEDSMIKIQIDIHEKSLYLNVENNKVSVDHKTYERLGFGIENTKNRLNLMYPDAHKLHIFEDEKKYIVNLNITLI